MVRCSRAHEKRDDPHIDPVAADDDDDDNTVEDAHGAGDGEDAEDYDGLLTIIPVTVVPTMANMLSSVVLRSSFVTRNLLNKKLDSGRSRN